MRSGDVYRNIGEAAKELGVSAKALRLYEAAGLLKPLRTSADWRTYGLKEMTQAARIVGLRALGLSLAQIGRALSGDARGLSEALAARQARLAADAAEGRIAAAKIEELRRSLAANADKALHGLLRLAAEASQYDVQLDLPWPWGGERFGLRKLRPLTFITGPLGSGKTRLARMLAEKLPSANFLGLDRLERAAPTPLLARANDALTWLVEDGAVRSDALTVLIAAIEADEPGPLVVDMVEQGLDARTQTAVAAYLRKRREPTRRLVLLTRSSAIVDLDVADAECAILYCPANHGPPVCVEPYRGTPGYEAVESCLASPEVRQRTEGMIASMPAR